MRKIEPYQKCSRRNPLHTGPIAPAAPVKLAQIAMAFVRSPGGNTLIKIDKVDGMMNAAARPMSARQAISSPMEVDCDARVQPIRNSSRPSCSAPLRPNRSPSAPVVNNRPANTSE